MEAPKTYYQIWQLEKFANVLDDNDTHHMVDEDFENGHNEVDYQKMVAEIQIEAALHC